MAELDLDTVASIYSMSSEPDGLQKIVDLIKIFVDVDSAGVWLIKKNEVYSIAGTADIFESLDPYIAYYRNLDPWSMLPQPNGRVSLGSELFDESKLLRSEFYNDFARRFGMVRPMGVTLDLGSGVIAKIATNRTEGLLGQSDKGRLEVLTTHLTGALKLWHRLQASEARVDLLTRSLDKLAFGYVACAEDGTVQFANAAAERLASQGDGITFHGRRGRLGGATPQATQRIQDIIENAVRGRPGATRIRGKAETGWSVLATPLSPSAPGDLRAPALVTITRDDAPGPDPSTLQRVFDLSPAQATLAHQLSRGLTFEAAATERGIAISTARTHLTAILRKTGADNLRDLLRVLASLPRLTS